MRVKFNGEDITEKKKKKKEFESSISIFYDQDEHTNVPN